MMARRIRKSISVLLAAILVAGLAACGKTGETPTPTGTNSQDSKETVEETAATEAAKEPVTLTMWTYDDAQTPATQRMLDAFQKKYPYITVEHTCVGGAVAEYNAKMQSVLGTSDTPNVFWINFNLALEYIPMGFVKDLTDYIANDASVDLSKFNPGITDAYTVGGRYYAIPKDNDSMAVYYNEALFDAANVPYPADDWDMYEFAETCEKLTSDGVVGWTNATGDRIWDNFIWGNGGEIYSEDGMESVINSPEAAEAVQVYLDIMNNGYAFTGAQLAEVDENSAFTSGLAAMTISGSWMISQFYDALGDNLGIAEMPSGKAGKGSAGAGIGYATSTSNTHPEETWLLISFLASDEAQRMQADVVIPANLNVASDWEAAYPSLNLKPFVKALEYTKPVPFAAKNPSVTRVALQEVIGNMIAGGYEDAQAALDDAKKVMDESINQ
jgi:multiple sugar transport system substrate-binding protein